MITVNTLIKSIADETIYRVLWMSMEKDIAYLFDLCTQKMPFAVSCREIELRIDKGEWSNDVHDYYVQPVSENEIPEELKQLRNQTWELMQDILLCEPDIYEKNRRTQLVSEKSTCSNKTIMTIHRYMKRYWYYGKTINAFIPEYAKRGGKGQERSASVGSVKRGRPRKYDDSKGVNVDQNIQNIFEKSVKKYYHTRNEYTFKATYEMMLREHFSKPIKSPDGSMSYELLSVSELPTIGQFRYWYSKTYDVREKISKRKGETGFMLEHRAVLGKSDYGVIGPGAKYQIDATIADIYLVSRFDRANIIGRPVVYFIVDVFSRMVAGIYVGLEGPSWAGAMMALANAMSDKVKFCSEYGVEISESEWPCRHVPESILGDRGEMESNSVDTLINALNVRIENAPPYRGDMKGIVERQFRTINTNAVAFLPGHVKPDMSKRGGKDYRLDAKLDLQQFTKIMILNVLYHNNEHFLGTYERDADMISDGVPPIPIKLWEWGIPNRSGRLRSFDEETVKRCLMPTGTATVSAKGIKFKGIYYVSDRAVAGRWFETARANGSFKVDVSYDPRNMSSIYVRIPGENTYDTCHLADWENKYSNRRLEEIIYLLETEKLMRKQNEPLELKAKLDLNAEIEKVVHDAENMASQTVVSASKSERTKNIRENRTAEKEHNRHNEAFTSVEYKVIDDKVKESEAEEISPAMQLIIKDLEERLNGEE